jgi:hypothetical protein
MVRPDIQRIQHILRYCLEINDALRKYGATFDFFSIDKDFFDLVSMKLFQRLPGV